MSRLVGYEMRSVPGAGGTMGGQVPHVYAPVSLDAKGVGVLRSPILASDQQTRFTVEISLLGNGVNPLTGRARSTVRIHCPVYRAPLTVGEGAACCTAPTGTIIGVAHADLTIDFPAGITESEQGSFISSLKQTLFQTEFGGVQAGLFDPANPMFRTAALGEKLF